MRRSSAVRGCAAVRAGPVLGMGGSNKLLLPSGRCPRGRPDDAQVAQGLPLASSAPSSGRPAVFELDSVGMSACVSLVQAFIRLSYGPPPAVPRPLNPGVRPPRE